MAEIRRPVSPTAAPRAKDRTPETSSDIWAKLLAGPEVVVLAISRDALVIESDVRLRPGSGICLNVTVASASYQARGKITSVDAALAGGLLKYRVGIKLDADIPEFDSVPPSAARAANEGSTPQLVRTNGGTAADDPTLLERKTEELEARAVAADARAAAADARAAAAETRAQQVEVRLKEAEGRAGAAATEAELRIEQAEQILKAAQQRERALAATLTDAEAAWQKERAALQADVIGARAEAERTVAALEKDRRDATAQKARVSARLDATEKWCADQQELFYALQQQVGLLSTLLNDRQPPELIADDASNPVADDRASAVALAHKATG